MKPWWGWTALSVVLGLAVSVVRTAATDGSWGWDVVLRGLVGALFFLLLLPLAARSRRRARQRHG
ncbi:hypothetical protein [Streptomyces sp. NPDC049881]|uniref:hypothetical protein n=1 Tax=Streptomyces sp. NPDC049881 TaxID=3155778 RepID=UPI00342077C9